MKKPTAKPHLNANRISAIARQVFEREVSRQLGPDGRDTCLALAVALEQAGRHYARYRQQLDAVTIDLGHLPRHFKAGQFDALTNAHRRELERQVMAQVRGMLHVINTQRRFLDEFAAQMNALGASGQQALAAYRHGQATDGAELLTDDEADDDPTALT